MKCIILAAGYATRLYPITLNTPKPLLEVAGRSILDRIVDKIECVDEIDEIIVVTNDKFFPHFLKWMDTYRGNKQVQVLNDFTTSNETRLGAIKDVLFCIEQASIQDDVMVLAGDNLFDLDLKDFVAFFYQKNTDCITSHIIADRERIKRTGVAMINESHQLMSFEEKPQNPKSHFAVPPFYLYKKGTLSLIKQFIEEGHNGDAPGMLLSWLLTKKDIHVFLFDGNRYDIGTLESYQEVQEIFSNIK